MPTALPWPAALVGTPAVAVIEQAIARQRLSHSLLLHGDDLGTLEAVARGIADRLMNTAAAAGNLPTDQHPDCFQLRPAGKMRQISAEATRGMIDQLQQSPAVAPRKVAILHEVDRMNITAANIFSKRSRSHRPTRRLLLLTDAPLRAAPDNPQPCAAIPFSQHRGTGGGRRLAAVAR
jgi:DNA polymerase-3 subunit delta'